MGALASGRHGMSLNGIAKCCWNVSLDFRGILDGGNLLANLRDVLGTSGNKERARLHCPTLLLRAAFQVRSQDEL